MFTGRTHALLLIVNRDIRVINQHTGKLLRELVLDPTRDYQPRNPPQTDKNRPVGSAYAHVLSESVHRTG
jgi:hypothetical protein